MLKQEVKTNIPEETFVALPNRAPVGYDLEVSDGHLFVTNLSGLAKAEEITLKLNSCFL